MEETQDFLHLCAGIDRILLPVDMVHLITHRPALQSIPSEHPCFEGMLDLHGINVPVYGMAKFFTDKKPSYTLDTPLVLCDINESVTGFFVDEVYDVLSISNSTFSSDNTFKPPAYVSSIVEYDEQTFWILDPAFLIMHHTSKREKND